MLECRDRQGYHGEEINMPSREVEEFAMLLVQQVRDAAIQSCDMELEPEAKSPFAKRWRGVLASGKHGIADVLIADCVDKAVSALLRAIDQGVLRLSFTASDGRTIDLPEEGLGELWDGTAGAGAGVPGTKGEIRG